MIYFSELKGKKVVTEDMIEVGSLEDLIFSATEKPDITKIVINNKLNNPLVVPAQYLWKIDSKVLLKKDYQTATLEENELYLLKNILDKQIIDIQGNKIVRVNDVAIQDKAGFYIAGVDIGVLGLLRWFKLEKLFNRIVAKLHLKPVSQFLSWADIQPLELARGQVKLKKEENRLEKMRPEDLADYLEKTNLVNVKKILNILDEKFAASVVGNLNVNYQSSLFKLFSAEKAARIVSAIDPDDAVDVLLTLTEKKRNQVMAYLQEKKFNELKHLISLSKTPIGNLILPEFVTVYSEMTVSDVVKKIKNETEDFSFLQHIYVVNKQEELIGVFNLHELLLQSVDTRVYRFMTQNVVVVHLTTPGQIVLNKIIKYRLSALPVIDDKKHLVGIATIVDVINAFSR